MGFKEIAGDAFVAAKPGLKMALKGIVTSVVIPKLYDPALDWVKNKIPGVWDDVIIEGFRPKGKMELQKLIDAL